MSQNLAEIHILKNSELTLEDCLAKLEKYGNPRLGKDHGEWHCAISVFVIGKGTEFSVRSQFNHKTHSEAANVCYVRLLSELKRIKET